MNRPVALVACAGVLLAGTASSSRAAGPAEPAAVLADSGRAEKSALEAADASAHRALQERAADPQGAAREVAAKLAAAGPDDLAFAEPDPGMDEGVFAVTEAPASGSDFRPTSLWVGRLPDGTQAALYAGQHGWQESDGRVLLARFGQGGDLASASTIDIPGSGRLRVAGGDATGVVVSDATGATWTVDPVTGSVRCPC